MEIAVVGEDVRDSWHTGQRRLLRPEKKSWSLANLTVIWISVYVISSQVTRGSLAGWKQMSTAQAVLLADKVKAVLVCEKAVSRKWKSLPNREFWGNHSRVQSWSLSLSVPSFPLSLILTWFTLLIHKHLTLWLLWITFQYLLGCSPAPLWMRCVYCKRHYEKEESRMTLGFFCGHN